MLIFIHHAPFLRTTSTAILQLFDNLHCDSVAQRAEIFLQNVDIFDGTGPSRKKVYMGGVSKKSSRSERLKKARDERQAREKYRIETQAALRLQKLFRGYYCRNRVKNSLRKEFDGRMSDLVKVSHLLKALEKHFYALASFVRLIKNVLYSTLLRQQMILSAY